MVRFIALIMFLIASQSAMGSDVAEDIKTIAPNGLVLVVDGNGKTLVKRNADKAFIPASVAKIATAWLAMEVLGADYRFKTRFYMDNERILYVLGGGDPFLISEELALLAPMLLKKTGKKPFREIILDTSYYPAELRIPGITNNDEAYNALNSALAVNFNTIHAVRNGKTVRSAEKQTPITPLAISQFRKRGPNGRGRISLAQEDPKLGALYAGELLVEFIKKNGGAVQNGISIGNVPDDHKPVYVHHQSRPLSMIVRQMLLGSNNYIANQIFLEAGAQKLGSPVSVEKSLAVFDILLGNHNLNKDVKLVEGSGISQKNKVTAEGLVGMLDQFLPHAELLKRSRQGSRYKTGTLSNVSTLAGYAQTKKHGFVRFVIALPGRSGKLRFRILRTIEKAL